MKRLAPWRTKITSSESSHRRWHTALATMVLRWERLTKREQFLLVIAGILIGLTLIYTIAIRPAWQDMTRLHEELPRLRQQATTVGSLVREALAMQKNAFEHHDRNLLYVDLNTSLQNAVANGKHAMTLVDGRTTILEVDLNDVSVREFFDWLSVEPAGRALAISKLTLSRSPRPEQVSGSVSFRLAAEPP